MLPLPQRRAFASRDEFAAAVTLCFGDLHARYEAEPVLHSAPEWVNAPVVHSVALPLHVAREGGAPHGVANIIKHAIELKKTAITRMARVERDGFWIVYFEAT